MQTKEENINESIDIEESSENTNSNQEKDLSTNLEEVRRVFEIPSEPDLFEQAKKEHMLQSLQNGQKPAPEPDIDQCKSDFDYYILLLDPESSMYYRKIIGRNDFIRLEPLEDEDDRHKHQEIDDELEAGQQFNQDSKALVAQTKLKMMEKNAESLFKILKMLVLEGFSWTFMGEADSYRRRPFPMEFLQYEASDYPTYVHSSKLSKAFDHISGIETEVDLSEYADIIKQQDPSCDDQPSNTFKYSSRETLVTSTKEFIRNIIRDQFKKHNGVRLRPKKPNHILTLQVLGFREYLLGNYQLLQYEKVRVCLRSQAKLVLKLTEIDLNFRDQYFPPLFKMQKSITYPLLHIKKYKYEQQELHLKKWLEERTRLAKLLEKENKQNASHQKESKYKIMSTQKSSGNQPKTKNSKIEMAQQELQEQMNQMPDQDYIVTREEAARELNKKENQYNKEKDLIDWCQFEESSQYFWYSPVPNLRDESDKIMTQRKRVLGYNQQFSKSNPQVDVNNGLTERDKIEMNWVETPRDRQQISLSKHRLFNGGTTLPKNDELITIESGECNFQFKFKIVSLERIAQIFQEIKKQVATDNRDIIPKNVTLYYDTHEKDKSKKSKINPSKSTSKEYFNDPTIICETLKKHAHTLESQQMQKEKKENPRTEEDLKNIKNIHKIWKVKNFGKITKDELFAEEAIQRRFEMYKDHNFKKIQTPFCNFSDQSKTIEHYQNILRFSLGELTPWKIKIHCQLYHGCEILDHTIGEGITKEVYFSNNIVINEWVNFGTMRYCQLPMKTRLSISIILVFKEERQELVIGCVSTNLFDQKKRYCSGIRDLSLWPFYEIDERLGCMKEYNGREFDPKKSKNEKADVVRNIHNYFSKIILQFEEFNFPMYYSSRDIEVIEKWDKSVKDSIKLSLNKEDEEDREDLLKTGSDSSQEGTNKELADLKKAFTQNPIENLKTKDPKQLKTLFRTREHYQTYPQGLPLFLKSVKWHRPVQVNETYKMLENWAPMKPEDAISLLDANFPDERVRQYAVKRVEQLSDDELSLYMLQFAQALLYEEQHHSYLSDMLIKRSLQNPYIVGQTFFWTLKGNLYLKTSYERYYLLLEQFLMLSGRFRDELQIQVSLNENLAIVQNRVLKNRWGFIEHFEQPWMKKLFIDKGQKKRSKKQEPEEPDQTPLWMLPKEEQKIRKEQQAKQKSKKNKEETTDPMDLVKKNARADLAKERKNIPILFNHPLEPKLIVRDLIYDKCSCFKSKKVPMMLTFKNAYPGGESRRVMFKNGDDLRQDILTLQIIGIMDKIWLSYDLDLKMTPYKAIGTDCMQGYLEFIEDNVTLAGMQHKGSIPLITNKANVFNTFSRGTITKYMEEATRKECKAAMQSDPANDDLSKEEYAAKLEEIFQEKILEKRKTFASSAAGYCVVNYVLGLGDRHPDNIMIVIPNGRFLHIDFGHFLNHKKFKFGIEREIDPFVFTPEIAQFINGGPFKVPFFQGIFGCKPKIPAPMKDPNYIEEDQEEEEIQTTFTRDKTIIGGRRYGTKLSKYEDSDDEDETEKEFAASVSFEEDKKKQRFEEILKKTWDETKQGQGQNQEWQIKDGYIKSKLFLDFEKQCCRAFNILRKESHQLINLFLLMLSAGMPELKSIEDVEQLVKNLHLDKTEQEAAKYFKKQIHKAMDSWAMNRRRFDNFFHNVRAMHLSS